MMYNHLMACCLKANGKVLREFKDTVYVPFGQEYSILLKNLNKKRAVVNITIDGQNVVGDGLVVYGSQEIELERFITDLHKGNRFKFIERTASIENHRGSKVDDGLIRISFRYEKDIPVKQYIDTYTKRDMFGPTFGYDLRNNISGSLDSSTRGIQCSAANFEDSLARRINADNYSTVSKGGLSLNDSFAQAQAKSEIGITVEGSISEQKFQKVDDFPLETEEHILVIRILGDTGQGQVTQPVTVKSKPKCKSCGKVNKATAKFCSDCGTSLQII